MKAKHLFLMAAVVCLCACCGREYDTSRFHEKTELLRQEALADWMRQELSDAPAGDAGHAVFFSVCDGNAPADVYHGTGQTIDEAWETAVSNAEGALKKSGTEPKWVKTDVVYIAGEISDEDLREALNYSEVGFLTYGAAFDPLFETALLEQELNGADIYNYEDGGVDLDALNTYLKKQKREKLDSMPEDYILFQCAGWLCDEEDAVCRLDASGLSYGRRILEKVDDTVAADMVSSAAEYLAGRISKEGEISGADTMQQAEALHALLSARQISSGTETAEKIPLVAGNLAEKFGYSKKGKSAFQDGKDNALADCALTVAALAEYTDTFGDTQYLSFCRSMGEYLLSMLGEDAGNDNAVAAYALCKLYDATGETAWLDGAMRAAEYIPMQDYMQNQDFWAAFAMNELTKFVPEQGEYYAFVLETAQKNVEQLDAIETTSPAGLGMLTAAFETYTRMIENGGVATGFHLPLLLESIDTRAERQLDGYFFPETAMYMEHPSEILGTFMEREKGCEVGLDALCQNIESYYLYAKNYADIEKNRE